MNDVLASPHWYPRCYPTNPLHTYARTHIITYIYIWCMYIYIYPHKIYIFCIIRQVSLMMLFTCELLPLFTNPPGFVSAASISPRRPRRKAKRRSCSRKPWLDKILDGSMAQWMGFAWFCCEIWRGFSDLSIKHIQTWGLNMFSP